jgi:hypothetical protein
MTFITYDTADGSYPGGSRQMSLAQCQSLNEELRAQGESIRWIMASCDSCDSRVQVEYSGDGRMLCVRCRV